MVVGLGATVTALLITPSNWRGGEARATGSGPTNIVGAAIDGGMLLVRDSWTELTVERVMLFGLPVGTRVSFKRDAVEVPKAGSAKVITGKESVNQARAAVRLLGDATHADDAVELFDAAWYTPDHVAERTIPKLRVAAVLFRFGPWVAAAGAVLGLVGFLRQGG